MWRLFQIGTNSQVGRLWLGWQLTAFQGQPISSLRAKLCQFGQSSSGKNISKCDCGAFFANYTELWFLAWREMRRSEVVGLSYRNLVRKSRCCPRKDQSDNPPNYPKQNVKNQVNSICCNVDFVEANLTKRSYLLPLLPALVLYHQIIWCGGYPTAGSHNVFVIPSSLPGKDWF